MFGRGRVRRCRAVSGSGRSGAAALHSVRYNERSQPEVLERRSPTGIARKRETRTTNPTPRQFHAYKPTHHQPHRITGTWSAGQFSRWGPPTGIARQRETRPNNAGPTNLTPTNPRIANRAESRRHGALASSPGGGLRPASRGSAKPAPTTPPPANLTPANPRIANRAESRGAWSAGLRPASRGSAKPAPTTPPPANLTPANPRITNRAESRRHGAPVSDRHRAEARNPHQQRWPRQSHGREPTHRQPR